MRGREILFETVSDAFWIYIDWDFYFFVWQLVDDQTIAEVQLQIQVRGGVKKLASQNCARKVK